MHTSDEEFIDDGEEEQESDDWTVDREGIMNKSNEEIAKYSGSTLGMKRFNAVILAIERQAQEKAAKAEKRKNARRALAAPAT